MVAYLRWVAQGVVLRMGLAVVVAAGVAFALLTGSAAGRRVATPAPTPVALRSAAVGGCGKPAVAGTTGLTLQVDGRQRTVRVHVPHGYTGERAVALVLNLHGSASTASRQEAATGLDATADRYTFIVAFPQGDRRAGPGFSWNVPGVPVGAGARQADDVGFLGQVVSLLRRRYCIDRGEIYASGFSGGARMVSQAVCHPSSPFAAMAVVGGLRAPVTCPAGRAVPVLAFHGTADSMNPYNGHGQSYWTYSVPAAATRWAGYDGCTGTPVTVRPFPSVAVTGYGGCHDAASVELYTLIGKGHRWPGVETLAGAGTAFDANAIMWRFFSAHPLR